MCIVISPIIAKNKKIIAFPVRNRVSILYLQANNLSGLSALAIRNYRTYFGHFQSFFQNYKLLITKCEAIPIHLEIKIK